MFWYRMRIIHGEDHPPLIRNLAAIRMPLLSGTTVFSTTAFSNCVTLLVAMTTAEDDDDGLSETVETVICLSFQGSSPDGLCEFELLLYGALHHMAWRPRLVMIVVPLSWEQVMPEFGTIEHQN